MNFSIKRKSVYLAAKVSKERVVWQPLPRFQTRERMKIMTEKLQNLWNSDEVRVLVLTSLGTQIALITLAPLRKRITKIMFSLTLLLLYLTADYVATLGLGNIISQTLTGSGVSSELTILWAPFLLVHLGGPDTITSYSIEDNELWRRHLLGLLFQVIFTVFIFIQSPPTGWLWIPTIFVFIPGLIKFAERTHAFRLASKDYLYDKISSELRHENRTMTVSWDNTPSNTGQANETTIVSTDNTPLNADEAKKPTKGFWGKLMGSIQSVLFPPEDTIVNLDQPFPDISEDESAAILEGFRWFNIYKRLLVDLPLSADLLMKSQDRFSYLSSTDALRLVAIELSFLYDYLHTKAVNVHSILGRALRYFSLVSIIAALVVFHHLDMQKYVSVDIIITYILFGVALSLEVIATIRLVFNHWTVVALQRTEHGQCVANCISALVKRIWKKGTQWWACNIGHFNLIDFSLRDEDTVLAKIMRILKIKNKWDNMREKKLNPLLPGGLLEEIMVTEAKRRAPNVHIYKVLVEARLYRGNKTLERHNQLEKLEWSMKREFDESIILWHLATDICYYEDEPSNQPNGRKKKPINLTCGLKSSKQPNEENQEPSHQPCCLKSCLSSKQSKENQEPSHQPDGENQQPSDQLDGENQEPSHQPCCLKSCLSSKQSNENQEPSHQPNGENQEPSHPPINGTCGLKSCSFGTSKQPNGKKGTERDVGWKTSNYMMYILTQQQSMMFVGWGKIRLETTCAIIKNIFKGKGKLKGKEARKELMKHAKNNGAPPVLGADGSQPTNKMGTSVLKKIWEILRWCTPPVVKNWGKRKREEDKRKRMDENEMGELVLRDSRRLAKELQELKPEIKWKLISETWMEMLGYAAIHCDAYQHAKSVSRGGELLTHLWLLMSQLGFVEEHKLEQFETVSV